MKPTKEILQELRFEYIEKFKKASHEGEKIHISEMLIKIEHQLNKRFNTCYQTIQPKTIKSNGNTICYYWDFP